MRSRPPRYAHGAALDPRRIVTLLLVAALLPLAGHQPQLAQIRSQAGSDASGPPILRTIIVGPHPLAMAVDAPANRVFVVNQGHWNQFEQSSGPASVSMLDATTGAVLHTTRLGVLHYLGSGNSIDTGLPLQEVAVDARTRRVFVLDAGTLSEDGTFLYGPGWVYVLDATTDALLRKVLLPPGPQAVVADERLGRVFVGNNYDGSISTLDATTGRVLHLTTLTYGEGPLTLALDERTNRLFVNGGQALTMLDAATGQELLTTSPAGGIGLDARAGRLFAGEVLIRDAATGRALVRRPIGAVAYADLLAVDATTHHAFVLTDASLRHAPEGPYAMLLIDTRTGRTLHAEFIETGVPTLEVDGSVALDAAIGRLYLGIGIGVDAVDTHSGRSLRTRAIGEGDPVIAVDARTNHLFIAGHGGNTVTVLNAAAW